MREMVRLLEEEYEELKQVHTYQSHPTYLRHI